MKEAFRLMIASAGSSSSSTRGKTNRGESLRWVCGNRCWKEWFAFENRFFVLKTLEVQKTQLVIPIYLSIVIWTRISAYLQRGLQMKERSPGKPDDVFNGSFSENDSAPNFLLSIAIAMKPLIIIWTFSRTTLTCVFVYVYNECLYVHVCVCVCVCACARASVCVCVCV